MRPQAHLRTQAKDRVLQRHTTLRDEEPDKTTLLAALLGCVAAGERIVCVEEAPELEPGHPHVVRLTARQPNIEGAGEVTLRDLVRQAL